MRNLCGSVIENTFLGLTKTQSNFLLYKLIDAREYIQKLQTDYPDGDIDIKQLYTIMNSIYPNQENLELKNSFSLLAERFILTLRGIMNCKMLRFLEGWVDHLLTDKMRLKESLHGHPLILPNLEYFPTEFIQILKKNGDYLDGLITYNSQSNH